MDNINDTQTTSSFLNFKSIKEFVMDNLYSVIIAVFILCFIILMYFYPFKIIKRNLFTSSSEINDLCVSIDLKQTKTVGNKFTDASKLIDGYTTLKLYVQDSENCVTLLKLMNKHIDKINSVSYYIFIKCVSKNEANELRNQGITKLPLLIGLKKRNGSKMKINEENKIIGMKNIKTYFNELLLSKNGKSTKKSSSPQAINEIDKEDNIDENTMNDYLSKEVFKGAQVDKRSGNKAAIITFKDDDEHNSTESLSGVNINNLMQQRPTSVVSGGSSSRYQFGDEDEDKDNKEKDFDDKIESYNKQKSMPLKPSKYNIGGITDQPNVDYGNNIGNSQYDDDDNVGENNDYKYNDETDEYDEDKVKDFMLK